MLEQHFYLSSIWIFFQEWVYCQCPWIICRFALLLLQSQSKQPEFCMVKLKWHYFKTKLVSCQAYCMPYTYKVSIFVPDFNISVTVLLYKLVFKIFKSLFSFLISWLHLKTNKTLTIGAKHENFAKKLCSPVKSRKINT